MPAVPIRPQDQQAQRPMPPLDQKYLMMAASQMHSEGRLIDERTTAAEFHRRMDQAHPAPLGHSEGEAQGQSDIKASDDPAFQPTNPQLGDIDRLFQDRIINQRRPGASI